MIKARIYSIFCYLFLFFSALVSAQSTNFDAQRAFQLLEKICAFGPRVPGSAAHQNCRNFINGEMQKLGYKVFLQEFEAEPKLLGKRVSLFNIIAYDEPLATGTIILLSSHWDSRPIAELDPNPRLRQKPIIGANDGASGNAVMLELGRVAKIRRFSRSIIFVFFDGEDLGSKKNPEEYCLGSGYLAKFPPPFLRFTLGINLDMVADKDLLIKIEPYSYNAAPQLVEEFWDIAQAEYPRQFSREFSPPIFDDHYPFITQGKPYINIIDFDYPWWHTQKDIPEQCSPQSLQIIGNSLIKFLTLKLKIG